MKPEISCVSLNLTSFKACGETTLFTPEENLRETDETMD